MLYVRIILGLGLVLGSELKFRIWLVSEMEHGNRLPQGHVVY